MNNKFKGKLLISIGWMSILVNVGTFIVSSILASVSSFKWSGTMNYLMGISPYVIVGIVLIWLGGRIQKKSESN